jgi:L-alanine-DL-glutamate epimerase-like enolase superfamily enzyme
MPMPEPGRSPHVRMTAVSHALLALLAREAGVPVVRYLERLVLGQAMVAGLEIRKLGEESQEKGGKR